MTDPRADYLIVGASHAALSALHAIRQHDPEGSVTMLTRDDAYPYSPTVLPYVVSGRSDPQRVILRDQPFFDRHRVDFRRGARVQGVRAAESTVTLADGSRFAYRKLLVASGAAPALPKISGLSGVRFHVLRTLADAVALRDALPHTRRALVLGGGLIGMHAAENLAKGGARVTLAEMQSQVLPGYFDAEAAAIIGAVFAARGVELLTGTTVASVAANGTGVRATMADGRAAEADLLLIATGVAPVTDFLEGSGVEVDRGVLVDESMRSSVAGIWAAGDVAQASSFFDGRRTLNGILPDAVDQGRIAGMAMAGDPGARRYAGAVPLNTYTFFGQQAVSVGVQPESLAQGGVQVHRSVDAGRSRYLKIVLADGRLAGIFGINTAFDPGIMWELVVRRIDLAAVADAFVTDPQRTARALMSRHWR